MSLPYEILIRCNDGIYSGSHAIDLPGGVARTIDKADLPELFAGINADALGQLKTVTDERDALAALKTTMEAQVLAALKSGDPSQFAEIGLAFVTPAEEKARAEKLAQYEALKTELGIA